MRSLFWKELDDALKSLYGSNRELEIRFGKAVPHGLDMTLKADVYYKIYAYFYYCNEFSERIIQSHHVYVVRDSQEKYIINDAGFKSKDMRQKVMIARLTSLENLLDVCITASDTNRSSESLLQPMHLSICDRSLCSRGRITDKYHVETVILKYFDSHILQFAKQTDLQTMQIDYTVRMIVSPPDVTQASTGAQASDGSHCCRNIPSAEMLIDTVIKLTELQNLTESVQLNNSCIRKINTSSSQQLNAMLASQSRTPYEVAYENKLVHVV